MEAESARVRPVLVAVDEAGCSGVASGKDEVEKRFVLPKRLPFRGTLPTLLIEALFMSVGEDGAGDPGGDMIGDTAKVADLDGEGDARRLGDR